MTNDEPTLKQLENRLNNLEAENDQFRAEITELKKIIKKLENQLLIYNGPNSPSSQNPPYMKNQKDAGERKSRRVKKKRGREKGHKGSTLVLEATKIVHDYIQQCNHCHRTIADNIQYQLYSYQEVEFPDEIKLDVIQHNVYGATCLGCGSEVNTDKKNKGTILGDNMRAFVSLLYQVGRTPLAGISEIIASFLNQEFSESMIHKALVANAGVMDKEVEEIKKDVLASNSLHIDETSYTVVIGNRELGWIWVYASKNGVYYDFAKTRGKEEFDKIINLDPGGKVIVVDGYNAYSSYPNKQRCWAHILRESKALSKKSDVGWRIHNMLTEVFDSIKATLPTKNPNVIKNHAITKINAILNLGKQDEQACQFLDKLNRAKMDLLTAIDYDFVDLTNNLAEQLLRNIVLHRKIRRFVASENGKKILVNHATTFQTWKLRGLNPYQQFKKLLNINDASAA